MQDDTDAAVATTLQMVAKSKAGFYSNNAGPSRQAMDQQSVVPFPDANSEIPLSDMTSSTAGERRPNDTVLATDGREEDSTTAAADQVPAIRRADTESGGHQLTPPTQLTHLLTPLRKTRMLLIMFLLQAIFYVLFAITLGGVGHAFSNETPVVFSLLIGSAFIGGTAIISSFSRVKGNRGSGDLIGHKYFLLLLLVLIVMVTGGLVSALLLYFFFFWIGE